MDMFKFLEKVTKPSLKNIYFLDRNVISLIKNINNGKKISDDKKYIQVKLKDIDSRRNIITPILSLFEGEHSRFENESEIDIIVRKEIYNLKKFFSCAEIDKPTRKCLLPLFKKGKLSSEFQTNIENKINFLEKINQYIYQPVKPQKKEVFKDEIIETLKKLNIDKFDPVAILALCSLYGNEMCKKILKPKENLDKTNYYNAVMDIQHFSFYVFLCGQVEKIYSRKQNAILHCNFLTDDKNLNEFFSWFNFNNAKSHILNESMNLKITLTDKGMKEIPNELKEILNIEI